MWRGVEAVEFAGHPLRATTLLCGARRMLRPWCLSAWCCGERRNDHWRESRDTRPQSESGPRRSRYRRSTTKKTKGHRIARKHTTHQRQAGRQTEPENSPRPNPPVNQPLEGHEPSRERFGGDQGRPGTPSHPSASHPVLAAIPLRAVRRRPTDREPSFNHLHGWLRERSSFSLHSREPIKKLPAASLLAMASKPENGYRAENHQPTTENGYRGRKRLRQPKRSEGRQPGVDVTVSLGNAQFQLKFSAIVLL